MLVRCDFRASRPHASSRPDAIRHSRRLARLPAARPSARDRARARSRARSLAAARRARAGAGRHHGRRHQRQGLDGRVSRSDAASPDGQRVGAYTSPHLLRYNERVRIDGVDVDDAALIDAFERIEAARGDIALTYFEYGTLAALLIFAEARARRRVARSRARRPARRRQHHRRRRRDRDDGRPRSPGLARQRSRQHRAREGRHLPRRPAGDHRRCAIRRAACSTKRRASVADLRIAGRDFSVDIRASDWRWRERRRRSRAAASGAGRAVPARKRRGRDRGAACACATRLGWNPDAIARGVANARVGARLQRFASAARARSSTSRTTRRPRACSRRGSRASDRADARSRCSARSPTRTCAASSSRCATSSTHGISPASRSESPRGLVVGRARAISCVGAHATSTSPARHDDVESALDGRVRERGARRSRHRVRLVLHRRGGAAIRRGARFRSPVNADTARAGGYNRADSSGRALYGSVAETTSARRGRADRTRGDLRADAAVGPGAAADVGNA